MLTLTAKENKILNLHLEDDSIDVNIEVKESQLGELRNDLKLIDQSLTFLEESHYYDD